MGPHWWTLREGLGVGSLAIGQGVLSESSMKEREKAQEEIGRPPSQQEMADTLMKKRTKPKKEVKKYQFWIRTRTKIQKLAGSITGE